MSVDVVRAAVSGPSGVPQTESATWQRVLSQDLIQVCDLAGLLGEVDGSIRHDGDPRGVVPPILQPPQTLHYHIYGGLRPDIANNSAHRQQG
jgi:hypothetical protein